jgi:hypothetical protein
VSFTRAMAAAQRDAIVDALRCAANEKARPLTASAAREAITAVQRDTSSRLPSLTEAVKQDRGPEDGIDGILHAVPEEVPRRSPSGSSHMTCRCAILQDPWTGCRSCSSS